MSKDLYFQRQTNVQKVNRKCPTSQIPETNANQNHGILPQNCWDVNQKQDVR